MFDTMQIMTEHDAELPRWALTIADAARVVSLSEDTLRRAIGRNELRARKVGNRLLIEPADLERWWKSLPANIDGPRPRGRPKGSRNAPKGDQ